MKEFVRSNKSTVISFCVVAFLFAAAITAALLFNDVTPAALLQV